MVGVNGGPSGINVLTQNQGAFSESPIGPRSGTGMERAVGEVRSGLAEVLMPGARLLRLSGWFCVKSTRDRLPVRH